MLFHSNPAASGYEVLNHLATKLRKLFMSPGMQICQLIVIKAQKMKHRYVHVSNRVNAFCSRSAKFIRCPNNTWPYAAPSK